MGEATKSLARSARDEGTESDGEQRTSDDKETEAEDPSELMEDPPPPRQAKKKPRKKNAPSSALVSPPAGRGLRDAGSPSKATKVVEATPPSMDDPDDVLALLRGEIEEKYGAKAAESLPMRLPPKERGQINKLLLDRYEPSVVIRMVRVLVWDWEIARAECFPPKTHMRYPRVEALAQYQEALSSVVDTGFTYSGGRRGEWNTYAMRYLKNANPSASADPF